MLLSHGRQSTLLLAKVRVTLCGDLSQRIEFLLRIGSLFIKGINLSF